MDIILTAIGEFVWATSCAVVNFCLSSGLSVLAIFVSLLSIVLASSLFKYMSIREEMPTDHNENQNSISDQISSEPFLFMPSFQTDFVDSQSKLMDHSSSLEEVQVQITTNDYQCHEEEAQEDDENERQDQEPNQSNGIFIDTIEGSEDEIQKKQIANIYRLLNDQNLINNWTSTDFLDQLKMYGLPGYDENELDSCLDSVE